MVISGYGFVRHGLFRFITCLVASTECPVAALKRGYSSLEPGAVCSRCNGSWPLYMSYDKVALGGGLGQTEADVVGGRWMIG